MRVMHVRTNGISIGVMEAEKLSNITTYPSLGKGLCNLWQNERLHPMEKLMYVFKDT